MSEIKKIQKGIELYENKYEIISNKNEINQIKINELFEIISQLKIFQITCFKIINKLEDKDPITQTPRYGPNMKQKIIKLNLDLNLTTEKYEILLQNITEIFNKRNEELKEIILKQNEIQIENNNTDNNNNNNNNNDNNTNNNNNQNDNDNNEILNEKAEIIRKKKRKQAYMERLKQYEELKSYLSAVDNLNKIYSSTSSNNEYVERAMNNLINSQINNTESIGKKQIVNFVVEILEAVSRRPDDEKLRRIRVNHPAIKKKVGSYLLNVVYLLLSVGFIAKLTLFDGSIIPPELLLPVANIDEDNLNETQESESNQSINDSFDAQKSNQSNESNNDLLDSVMMIQDLISSPTQINYTLLLEMIEPSIDLNPSDLWIRWFDSLKENIDRLQAYHI